MASALAAALVVAGLAWMPFKADDSKPPSPEGGASSSNQADPWGLRKLPRDPRLEPAASPSTPTDLARAAPNPLDTIAPPVFRARPNGNLVLDGQTRSDVERLNALYPREEALGKLERFTQDLPETARREVKDLYQQYVQYDQAVRQTYPPGEAMSSVDEAAKQLDGLHKLRQQYFGAERAEAMFGEEEALSLQLLATMRQQKDTKLSLSEKAEIAQEALKKSDPSQP